MRWTAAPQSERQPTHQHRRRAKAACGAPLAVLGLVLMLGCVPAHGTGAVATPTAVPAATPVPCPTPAGTPSPTQQRLAGAVSAAVGAVPCLDTAYRAADRTARVTVTIGGLVPTTPAAIAAAQERVKVLSFQAQRALWTTGVALTGATVAVLGPYLDPYNGPTIAPYASAYLVARTAATFSWDTLSPDAAWTKYNDTYLRPGFDPADGVPTPTP